MTDTCPTCGMDDNELIGDSMARCSDAWHTTEPAPTPPTDYGIEDARRDLAYLLKAALMSPESEVHYDFDDEAHRVLSLLEYLAEEVVRVTEMHAESFRIAYQNQERIEALTTERNALFDVVRADDPEPTLPSIRWIGTPPWCEIRAMQRAWRRRQHLRANPLVRQALEETP